MSHARTLQIISGWARSVCAGWYQISRNTVGCVREPVPLGVCLHGPALVFVTSNLLILISRIPCVLLGDSTSKSRSSFSADSWYYLYERCVGNLVDRFNNSVIEEGWYLHLSASGFISPSGIFSTFDIYMCLDDECAYSEPNQPVAINDPTAVVPVPPGNTIRFEPRIDCGR